MFNGHGVRECGFDLSREGFFALIRSQLTHISQFPNRKLPQSISGQREGEHASVLQLGRQVGHGDLSAVHGAQVVTGVGAETVRVELTRLHLPPVQDLGGVCQAGQETVETHQEPKPHAEGEECGGSLQSKLNILNLVNREPHKVELNVHH